MILLLLACVPDDVGTCPAGYVVVDGVCVGDTAAPQDSENGGGDDTEATGDDSEESPVDEQDIVGHWLSTGDDLSPLFEASPFSYSKVEAYFVADGSYTVTATTGSKDYDFSGTYAVDTGTTPGTITLSQSSPYSATASGIWQIDGDKLTYEVVQSGGGFTAPTPETGFGSSKGSGLEPGDNVQVYRRQ